MSNKKRGSSAIDPEVYSYLRQRGHPEHVARGVAAGVYAESANDPDVRGGYKGRAVGLGQWLGPRREKLLGQFGPKPTKRQQLAFLDMELRGGDAGGPKVLSQKTEEAVLHSYIKDFMRPAKGAETEGDLKRGYAALGKSYKGSVKPKYSQEVGGGASITTTDLKDIPLDELIHSTPDELFADGRRPLRPEGPEAKAAKPDKKQRMTDLLTGGKGLSVTPKLDLTPVRAEAEDEARSVATQAANDKLGFLDRAGAAIEETWIVPQIIDALSQEEGDFDPQFQSQYKRNWQQIEQFAQNDDEVDQLREARNATHLEQIKSSILESRENNRIIDSNGTGTAFRLGAGFLDPAGWLAGFGVAKGAQLAGVGSFALAGSGRTGSAVLSSSVEGMVGNVAIDAALDASGEHVSAEQYGLSALIGLGIGGAMSPLTIRAGRQAEYENLIADAVVQEERIIQEAEAAARAKLGPDATPEDIAAEVKQDWLTRRKEAVDYALADIPESERLLVSDEIMTADRLVKEQQVNENDLASVSDNVERSMIAELTARANKIVAQNPINTANLKTMLERIGMESPAMRLLKSESPVARAAALTLLENPSGAGGRRRTAAIVQATRERIYNEGLTGYDVLADQFRRQEGVSRAKDFWNGEGRNEFNRRVFFEIEARQHNEPGKYHDPSPIVQRAADLFENGMEHMRIEQQKVGVVGSARLGEGSRGYVPHRLDPRAILGLTDAQLKAVRGVLSEQFQRIEGFDKTFSDKLAAKYLERPADAAHGRYHVPFNLYSPEAGAMVRDALKALNLTPDEIDKAMGKFSRGGASHTKQRLKLNLMQDIGDGKKLGDLFVTDIPALYRSYARRVSGDVALAQYGVMGSKGLQLMSKAMSETGASPDDIRAFDQIASEFLNAPVGWVKEAPNWKWMDNLRVMTSASRLGGMGFTQFAEFANAIPALGVKAALKGVAGMPQMVKKVQAIARGDKTPDPVLQSIDQMGGHLGMEDYTMSRLFDVKDNSIELYNGESLDVVTRAIRGTGNGIMVASGHRIIMASQTRLMAEMILRKAVTFARKGDNDTALRDMGFSDGLLNALKQDLDDVAKFDGDNLTELDLFKGKHLTKPQIAELVQAVERGSAQIIQRTFTGETGAWAHNSFLKLLFQFRTFSLTALEKQWGRNLNNYGAAGAFMKLMAVMPFALTVHFARLQAKMIGMDAAQRDEYEDKYMSPLAMGRAVLNYASAAGLAGDILDLGAGFADSWIPGASEALGTDQLVRGGGGKLIGGVMAPGVGYLEDVWSATHGNGKAAIRAIPGSNLPYVTPFITALMEE